SPFRRAVDSLSPCMYSAAAFFPVSFGVSPPIEEIRMTQFCNVALLGQKFMGRAHSNAYLKVGKFFNIPIQPVMHTVVGQDLISLAPFASRWGWKKYSTQWKDVVKDTAVN